MLTAPEEVYRSSTYFWWATIQSLAIAACASSRLNAPLQTSLCSRSSSLSLARPFQGCVSRLSGHRLRMSFAPPRSRLIKSRRHRTGDLDAVFAVNQRLRFPVDVAHGFRIARSAHLRGRDWYDCTWRQIRPEWRIRGKGGPADQQQYDRDKTGLPAAPQLKVPPALASCGAS